MEQTNAQVHIFRKNTHISFLEVLKVTNKVDVALATSMEALNYIKGKYNNNNYRSVGSFDITAPSEDECLNRLERFILDDNNSYGVGIGPVEDYIIDEQMGLYIYRIDEKSVNMLLDFLKSDRVMGNKEG